MTRLGLCLFCLAATFGLTATGWLWSALFTWLLSVACLFAMHFGPVEVDPREPK